MTTLRGHASFGSHGAHRLRRILRHCRDAAAALLSYGITLIISPHSSGRLADLAYLLFATLLVSLQRAWALLRGTELRRAADASATAGPSGEQGAAG